MALAEAYKRGSSYIQRSDILRGLKGSLQLMISERTTRIYLYILLFMSALGIFGPSLAPYGYQERLYDSQGQLMVLAEPSLAHPLGTTVDAYDVFSRLIYGAQPTILAGFLGGLIVISIGLTVGLTSGYFGGRTDSALMRMTDMIYGIPLLPFALVLSALFGMGYFESILVIGIILWRGSARVIRAQVLQIRERPFILSAKATGASRPYIIIRHVLPNVAPMAVLFFALTTGATIVLIAGLAFLGAANPYIPSWGVMVRNAFNSGTVHTAVWWSLPPGLGIAITVLSLYMFGRGYEKVASGEEAGDQAVAQTG